MIYMFRKTKYHHCIFNSRTKKFAKYSDTASFGKVVTSQQIFTMAIENHNMESVVASVSSVRVVTKVRELILLMIIR